MSFAKNAAALAAVSILCSGCTYWPNQAEALLKGQALIADNVYLLQQKSTPGGQSTDMEMLDGRNENLPKPCQDGGANTGAAKDKGLNTWTSKDNADEIRQCAYAMKLLIDVRWAHFSDSIHGTVSYGNATLDSASLGLNAAATVIGGDTNQILSAIAGGLGGFKATLNQDVLYKNSIELILLQMQTNRAVWAKTIETKLGPKLQYNNMYEVAGDLFQYARAGSWTEALTSLQSDTSARKQACENQLMYTKLNSEGTVASGTNDAEKAVLDDKTRALLAISNNQAALLDVCAAYRQNNPVTEKKDAVNETVQPVKITFEKGLSKLSDKDKTSIQTLANAFKTGDTISVTIDTDRSGSREANTKVYKKRLEVITEALTEKNSAIDAKANIQGTPHPNSDLNTTITLVKAAK